MLKVSVKPIELQLRTPITVGPARLASRRGFQIRLEDLVSSSGAFGLGECLPLPGLHRETDQECMEQFEEIKSELRSRILDFHSFDLSKPYFRLFDPLSFEPKLHPSLEFAIEQALLALFIRAQPQVLDQVFQIRKNRFDTSVNGLLIPNESSFGDVNRIAQEILDEGFTVLKVKVGRFSENEEISFIQTLAGCLGGKCKLRLDGNCLFTENQFISFFKRFNEADQANIEYFEEPLNSSIGNSRLEFYSNSQIPIALDESLAQALEGLRNGVPLPSSISALVVKPTTVGGIHQAVNIIRLCNQKNLKCVLSSAFDSGGMTATYALLAQLVEDKTAMGLDTYKYLETDVLDARLSFGQGKLSLDKAFFLTG